jgi:hypothetical protein
MAWSFYFAIKNRWNPCQTRNRGVTTKIVTARVASGTAWRREKHKPAKSPARLVSGVVRFRRLPPGSPAVRTQYIQTLWW